MVVMVNPGIDQISLMLVNPVIFVILTMVVLVILTTVVLDESSPEDVSEVDVESQINPGPLSTQGSVDPELGHSSRPDQPNINAGMVRYVVEQTLGPNKSNPIWWLILLAAVSLVAATTIGIVLLPGYLHQVHATYLKVLLIMTVGAPIVVSVCTLLVSFHLASDPDGRNGNWITGLSIANLSMLLGSLLAVYWAHQRGTGK